MKTRRPGRAGEVALKADGGELGIGAIVVVRSAENTVESIPDARHVVEVADIGVALVEGDGVAFGGQRRVGGGAGEVVARRPEVLRELVGRRIVAGIEQPDGAVLKYRQCRQRGFDPPATAGVANFWVQVMPPLVDSVTTNCSSPEWSGP